jgi:serine/threonine protein kinase
MPWGDLKNPIKLNKYLKELKEKQGELVNFPESWRFPVSSELKTLIKRMIAYDVKERITWNELFKSTGVFLEGGKKNKKGISPLLYKKIDEKNINKAMENYCSPMLWMDVNEGNVNKIKIWEYTKSQYCKGN